MTGGGRSGSGGGSGGVPGGGCGVGPWATLERRIRTSKIGAPPFVFPVPIAGGFGSFWAADLARPRRVRLFGIGPSAGTGLSGVARLFFHEPNIGGAIVPSTVEFGRNGIMQ